MMIQPPAARTQLPRAPHWATSVCDGVHAAGVTDVVYVPDNPLSFVLRELERRYTDIRQVLATREEEAFGIAAGLYLGGRKPSVMLQSSGLGNSVNALGTLIVPYEIPMLIVVSMRGGDTEWNPVQEPMGSAVRPIFDALGIWHLTMSDTDSVSDTVRDAATAAFAGRIPRAILLPRRLTAS
jgi:sulfopyruvate decarboxylase alpha subunit